MCEELNSKKDNVKYTNYLQAVEENKDLCLTIAMEECAELIQAISKGKRGKLDKDNLAEEIADVLICMELINEIYDVDEKEIEKWFKKKAIRVIERLDKGEFK